ncbi:MAG: ABC transporter permease [Gemmatimonadetes bacterium]|nr:ABC transporter permease [Gemmatimonadota bacterium]
MTPRGFWRQLTRGLRALLDRRATDRDLTDEVDHYLAEAAAAHRAAGLSPAEALRAARLEVGSVTAVREEVRSAGWEHGVETLLSDLRQAGRRLRATPGFTIIAVLTSGLGIGATTAIFSAVKPILFEPLPYPDANRLVAIWEGGRDGTRMAPMFGSFRTIEEGTRTFERIAVLKAWQPTITGGDRPERLEGQRVSAGYFETLGVAPALGVGFATSDDRPGGGRTVILSDRLWRRRFGADLGILGTPISLDGDPHVVVGILPAEFENVMAPEAEVWTLLQYELDQGRAWGHHLRMVARLDPGHDLARARADLAAIGPDLKNLAAAGNGFFPGEFTLTPLAAEIRGGVAATLWAVIGAVLLVLVIAAVNVTNLLLARGAQRRGELAVRATLGAGRGRLVRQLLTESLLLATLGGLVGMAIAAAGVRLLVSRSPAGLPRLTAIDLDATVLVFGLLLTTVTGVAFGLAPAFQAAGRDPREGLQWTSRRTVGGQRRTRRALVVAEVALALILLVSSGLLFRSLSRLLSVDPGFAPANLLTMQIQTAGPRFASDTATTRFFQEALDRVRQVPGVVGAGLVNQLPLSGDRDEFGAHFEVGPGEEPRGFNVFRHAASPGYLETMGIPLRRGRLLAESDRAGAPLAVVISESLAQLAVPGGDPIGRRLAIGSLDGPRYTVVGVVGDVRHASLGLAETAAVYVTPAQWRFPDNAMSVVIKTARNPIGLTEAVRSAIWSVDRDQAIVRAATMADLVSASAAERRFALLLFEAFALTALILAVAGIYGVMSATVVERTREIGVRSALGASRLATVGMVVGQGMRLTAIGVVLGLAGALVATRAIAAMLFGVSHLDPITYLGVTGVLALAALLASAVPAWRAARVDPATTLRSE